MTRQLRLVVPRRERGLVPEDEFLESRKHMSMWAVTGREVLADSFASHPSVGFCSSPCFLDVVGCNRAY